MGAPRATLGIATHERDTYLAEAVASCLAQRCEDFEVLVVLDGGRNPRVEEIVAGFEDARLRVVRHDRNRGIAEAYNTIVQAARADLVGILGDDDVALPDRLARSLEVFERHPDTGVVHGDAEVIDAEGRTVGTWTSAELDPHALLALLVRRHNYLVDPTRLVHRRVYEAVGGYRPAYRLAQDFDFWLRAAPRFRFRHVPGGPLIRLRRHDANGSGERHRAREVAEVQAALLDALDDVELPLLVPEAAWEHLPRAAAERQAWGILAGALERRELAVPDVAAEARRRAALPAAARPAEPLVSVVVPAHDYERWVGAAVESALAQDYPRLEVIAVDDGSIDGTPEVLAGFGDRIRVIRRPNGGLNAATDTGIAAARGELLTFLDADDTWPAGRVRALVEALERRPDAGLAYGDMTVVDEHGAVVHPSFNAHKGFAEAPQGRILGRLLSFNCVSAGALMVRARLRGHFHPIPRFAAWNDWWIASQVTRVADVVAIPATVNTYRQHSENMNLGGGEERQVALLRAELPFRRWLLDTVGPGEATAADLLAGLRAYDWARGRVARADGCDPAAVAPGSALEAARARVACEDARALLARRDLDRALAALVRAAVLDPAWPAARALLEEVVALAGRGPLPPAPPTRRRIALAAVEDVLGRPELLVRWGALGADATLVIGGVADPATTRALVALVERLGLDADGAADLLAVAERDPGAVAARLGRPVDELLAA